LSRGWRLAVAGTEAGGGGPFLLEVYPHPALLILLPAGYRVPYKVSKATKYWPEASPRERIERLLGLFEVILAALKREVAGIELGLPRPEAVRSRASLKRYEDALDALVSAWVGIQFLEDRAEAFGDGTAAIWCPSMPEPVLAQNPGR
jgi:predicted RNase H-like nuclease